jgi:predicted nucleic acid-binding protein
MMRIEAALTGVNRLFLDTAPVVYFVEQNPEFIDRVEPIFARLDLDIIGVVSAVTLAECLVFPIKRGLTDLEQAFEDVVNSERVEFITTDREIATLTAIIRAKYNFQLPDSIQIATAISSNCDAFLTNDVALKKVTEIRAIVVSKLEL